MNARWLTLLALVGIGMGLALAATTSVWWVAAGAWAGAAGWILMDELQARRLRQWLRDGGEPSQAPRLRGFWGDLAHRMRRLVRHKQRATQEEKQRLDAFLLALQASPNGMILLDTHNCIVWINASACEYFDLQMPRDMAQSITHLLRQPEFATYLHAGVFARSITIAGTGHTERHPQRFSVQLHPYGDGNKLLLARDITALEQADSMRRDFVANVSHEIRTPLTVIAGFIETLRSIGCTPEEQQRYLELMSQQAIRMQNVVDDLLTLSRLEAQPLPGRSETVSVQQLLQHCEAEARALSNVLFASAAEPQQIHFPSEEHSRTFGHIAGSTKELQSALSNLVSNAVRYTPAGGRIDVLWKPLENGGAEFRVSDTGAGIAAEHIPRLTERFYRVDRSRSRESGGTGLGLAIVKHVLQRHGASLHIESMVGQGSHFSVRFPSERMMETIIA